MAGRPGLSGQSLSLPSPQRSLPSNVAPNTFRAPNRLSRRLQDGLPVGGPGRSVNLAQPAIAANVKYFGTMHPQLAPWAILSDVRFTRSSSSDWLAKNSISTYVLLLCGCSQSSAKDQSSCFSSRADDPRFSIFLDWIFYFCAFASSPLRRHRCIALRPPR